MGFLSYDGPLVTVLRKIGTFLLADILFLLGCIPLVTAGASFSALYYTVHKNLKRDEGYVWSQFFSSFRKNWRQTLPAGAVLFGIFAVFAADVWILRSLLERGHAVGNIYVLFYILGAVLAVYAIWLFAMIARFQNTLRSFLKNAAILMLRHLSASLVFLVLVAVFASLAYIVPVAALICPVLATWFISVPMEKIFAGYLTEEDQTKASDERS